MGLFAKLYLKSKNSTFSKLILCLLILKVIHGLNCNNLFCQKHSDIIGNSGIKGDMAYVLPYFT